MSPALLEVRELRKSFDGIVANDGVSIDVPQGGIVGLFGPNGSGKTTLFNAISGQQPADSGSVRFAGHEISGFGAPRIARLGVLRTFQQAHVYGRMSCLDNLRASAAERRGATSDLLGPPSAQARQRALELLDFVGLGEFAGSDAARVSFGQRKLLEFAMALMSRPRLLLLDEPTAGVDPGFVGRMIERLAQANSLMGVTLLVIEHNLDVLRVLARHIYMLERGAVVAQGSPVEIRDAMERVEVSREWAR